METISKINDVLYNFVWGIPAMICIVCVGVLLTVRTRALQLRKFPLAMKNTIGKIFSSKKSTDGSLSPFQAVCTALAGTVGTGNIAGVAGALAIGGPGAIFWMWCSALLGMCTKFAEVTLAIHYRERNADGEYVGGPMYYIKNGLGKGWKWLAVLYASFGVLTVFGTGNATQVNTIVSSINAAITSMSDISYDAGRFNLILGIIIAATVAMVLLGGIKRIGQVTEKLVPFMAVLYVIFALGVVFINIRTVPYVFKSIIAGAFTPSGFTGGIVGSMFVSLKKGVSRGIFSNEAGLGTGSIAHACADTDKPVEQGLFGIFEVFMDTIIICTLTALVILCSGITVPYGSDGAGADLTISGFVTTYGGWISILTAVAMCCFAFSTIIGWGLYGSRCIEFIFGSRSVRPFLVIYSFMAIVGATMDLGLLWKIAETFNGFMVIPNLIALFALSGVVVKLVKEYFNE